MYRAACGLLVTARAAGEPVSDEVFRMVWAESRQAGPWWGWWVAVGVGGYALCLASRIRVNVWRRGVKAAAVILAAGAAGWCSAAAIQAKWAYRFAWAQANEDGLTDRQWQAVTADGANLVIGPWLAVFGAGLILVVWVGVLHLVRRRAGTQSESGHSA